MRRILSIATIVALISSSLSPLMAAACTGTGKAMSCHAVAMPHCDRSMHEHHHHDGAPVESSSSVSVAEDDGTKCPMDCCNAGHPTTVATPSAASFLPPLAVSTRSLYFISVTFVSAGFSSHTDRGPPLA